MPDNIKIVHEDSIPHHSNYRRNCQFTYMEFKDVETVTFRRDPRENETMKRHLKNVMKGKQSLIWMRTIGDIGGLTSGDTTIMSGADADKYAKLPCCFKTPYGTLVPQVVIPTRNVVDNGLKYGGGIDAGGVTQKYKESGGYMWTAKPIDTSQLSGSTDLIDKVASSPLTYGERVPFFKCVTNEHSGKAAVDNPVYAERHYFCDTDDGPAGTGSCAFCYRIINYNEIGEGATTKQRELAPIMQVTLAGKLSDESSSDESNRIMASISKSGQLLGQFGSNVEQGSLSVPSSDIMPPQCTRSGDDYDLYPLFMYPLYNGFVMTNSVIGNLTEGSSSIFIQYEDEPQNPIYTVKVNNVRKSNEMNVMDEVDGTSELMKWFPTLYQESSNPQGIKLKVPRSEDIDFSDRIEVTFTKSLGRFAYCPIFFHRRIKFTLFFKGEYMSPNNDDGMDKTYGRYRFYPVICANIGKNILEEWEGLDADGAHCISDVTHVVDDDDLQESIYAVDFYFESSDFQRYPIEIFGAVAVYERQDFQFMVENDDGHFEFSKDVFDMFSGFVLEQKKFNEFALEQKKFSEKYMSLISNVSISASLDGVTGNMTLDGYPLKQGIQVFRQEQSIGETDLAVMQNGVRHPLFSGYAMELSTNDGDNSYNIGVNLYGINRKLEDMKLICAPFWDGDRLEMICAYFEEYANVQIKMIDHTVRSYADAKPVSINPYLNGDESWHSLWRSDSNTICNSTRVDHPSFRVPRSVDWRSPAVNFNTGTPVLEALKQLGMYTACYCVPELDGSLVFYELNNYGFPFYVDNQEDIVEFDPTDIVNISMSPQLQNKVNSVATFGFLQRKNAEGKVLAEGNVQYGAFYSKTNGGNFPNYGVQFPWSKQNVGVEAAMYTKMELAEVHANRVKFATAEQYLGNMTVRGNTRVNHMYQRIRVCNQDYFVVSIEHSLDLSSKVWTTSYQLQCINRTSNS